MFKEREAIIRKAIIALDAAVVFFAFILSFALRQFFHIFYKLHLIPSTVVVPPMTASLDDYIIVLFLIIPLWCMMLSLNGMYRSIRTKTIFEIVGIVIKTAFFVMLAFGLFVFLLKLKFVSRLFFAIFMICSSSFIVLEKIIIFSIMQYVRRYGYNYRRLLVVGTGKRSEYFIKKINTHPEWGIRIAGILDFDQSQVGKKIEEVDIIGTLKDIETILNNNPIDEVVFIVPRARLSEIENYLYVCETIGVKATIAVDLFDLKISRLRQTELDDIPLVTFETTFAMEWQLFFKRAMDLIISGLAIIILSPIFLLVAILIKITSKGPVMFLQKRVGLNGRRFILYKFRTMYKWADEKLEELKTLNEMKGPVFKIKDDPRITPVGRFLRKFSIDEFPQLFNVFVGHMSLVGPRPALSREVMQYEPWQRRRLSMRPGLTCLWQISGRSKIGFDEWMRLDLEYLDNWSLRLDFKILLKTIPVVLFGIGAY